MNVTEIRRPADHGKAHHNAGGLPEDMNFELVEPVRILFKDEVRVVGDELGLPHGMVYRQPFPDPGLGVRCRELSHAIVWKQYVNLTQFFVRNLKRMD